ncbi:hypothetical protein IWX78_003060 [Mycetocola sp. CAN_C7]|uniref:hypothetical protein n=1 Tax=Mycetocola sp. CAN_C7 TaxID=2787724 RepID=UPI0018CB2777
MFGEALSIIGAELARVAHVAAEELKDERLARIQAGRSTGPEASGIDDASVTSGGRARSQQKTTGGQKREAQGAERQAERDSR